jgi:hypothetical protein
VVGDASSIKVTVELTTLEIFSTLVDYRIR